MPMANVVLMLLIGVTFGGISAVFLRAKRSGFIMNILLGVMGASIGAFMPVILGTAPFVDVSSLDYLMRALVGAFLLVLTASLFRSAKTHST